jgi:FtsZ-interacting cell division protein ZipA
MGVMDTDTIGLIVLLIAIVALFFAARWQRRR